MDESNGVRQEDWRRDAARQLESVPVEVETPSLQTPSVETPSAMRYLFFGPNGLRPGWGLLMFVILFAVLTTTAGIVQHKLDRSPVKTSQQLKAGAVVPQKLASLLVGDGGVFAVLVLASWIMSRVERRSIGRFGFGGGHKVRNFFIGLLSGLVFLSVLVGVLWKARLLVFDGRLLFGAAAIKYGAAWAVGFLCVGLAEEYALRGYLQYTISRGFASLYGMLFETTYGETLGFWTAALVLSFLFGFGHGSNPGESAIGLWSAGLIGLIFCLTLWRTGSLWWALGFHAAWDWAQSFVFGVADSGTIVQEHLYASHPVGSVLLSGGSTGPEGSALVLPLLAVVSIVVVVTLPGRRWSIDGEMTPRVVIL